MVGSTVYVNYCGGNQLAVGYTSVTIALVTFNVYWHPCLSVGRCDCITQCLKKKYTDMRDTQWKTDIQVELKQKWSLSLILTLFD